MAWRGKERESERVFIVLLFVCSLCCSLCCFFVRLFGDSRPECAQHMFSVTNACLRPSASCVHRLPVCCSPFRWRRARARAHPLRSPVPQRVTRRRHHRQGAVSFGDDGVGTAQEAGGGDETGGRKAIIRLTIASLTGCRAGLTEIAAAGAETSRLACCRSSWRSSQRAKHASRSWCGKTQPRMAPLHSRSSSTQSRSSAQLGR